MKQLHILGAQIAALLSAAPALRLTNELTNDAKELLAALNASNDAVKNVANDALKGVGELKASVKEEADKRLTEQGELRAQMVELQQAIAAIPTAAAAAPTAQSLGARFVNDEGVKAYLANVANGKVASKVGVSATFDGPLMNAVTSLPASAGELKTPQYVPGIIPPGMQRLTIRDLLMWGTTSQASIQFFKELAFTNNAAIQSTELTALPVSDITFEADSANVVTIGHTLAASEQILADVPQLQSYIDGRLRYGLKLKEEGQLLKGSGVGVNLLGLYTAASAFSNPGVTVDAENRMDRLRIALLQAELSGYYADGIVLSPIDWTQIELKKTASDKQYLVGNPFGQLTPSLWGRPVVSSQSMTAGTYMVGAFGMAAQGWDRQSMTVEIDRSGDDFKNVALTLRAIERLALTIYRADALIKGSFGSVA